jgi:uncharacterized protein YegP (UPF0339 family)
MTFHIYRDSKREYRWRLKAKNGKILADSGEGYKSRMAILHAINIIQVRPSTITE